MSLSLGSMCKPYHGCAESVMFHRDGPAPALRPRWHWFTRFDRSKLILHVVTRNVHLTIKHVFGMHSRASALGLFQAVCAPRRVVEHGRFLAGIHAVQHIAVCVSRWTESDDALQREAGISRSDHSSIASITTCSRPSARNTVRSCASWSIIIQNATPISSAF